MQANSLVEKKKEEPFFIRCKFEIFTLIGFCFVFFVLVTLDYFFHIFTEQILNVHPSLLLIMCTWASVIFPCVLAVVLFWCGVFRGVYAAMQILFCAFLFAYISHIAFLHVFPDVKFGSHTDSNASTKKTQPYQALKLKSIGFQKTENIV